MAQKGGASAHKFNKAPGNLHFPGTGALTDSLTHGRTPGRGQHQRDILLQTNLNLPCEPQSGKTQTPEGACLGNGMTNSELGKNLSPPHSLHPSQLLSEAKQQEEHSLLPT